MGGDDFAEKLGDGEAIARVVVAGGVGYFGSFRSLRIFVPKLVEGRQCPAPGGLIVVDDKAVAREEGKLGILI